MIFLVAIICIDQTNYDVIISLIFCGLIISFSITQLIISEIFYKTNKTTIK